MPEAVAGTRCHARAHGLALAAFPLSDLPTIMDRHGHPDMLRSAKRRGPCPDSENAPRQPRPMQARAEACGADSDSHSAPYAQGSSTGRHVHRSANPYAPRRPARRPANDPRTDTRQLASVCAGKVENTSTWLHEEPRRRRQLPARRTRSAPPTRSLAGRVPPLPTVAGRLVEPAVTPGVPARGDRRGEPAKPTMPCRCDLPPSRQGRRCRGTPRVAGHGASSPRPQQTRRQAPVPRSRTRRPRRPHAVHRGTGRTSAICRDRLVPATARRRARPAAAPLADPEVAHLRALAPTSKTRRERRSATDRRAATAPCCSPIGQRRPRARASTGTSDKASGAWGGAPRGGHGRGAQ